MLSLLVYDFPQCICKVLLLDTFCSINCSVKWGCEGIGKTLQIFKHMTCNDTLPILWHIPVYQMEKLRQTGRTLFRVFRDWIQQQNTCSQILFPILIFCSCLRRPCSGYSQLWLKTVFKDKKLTAGTPNWQAWNQKPRELNN